MSRVSFAVVWDQARAFIVSEQALLAPVALAWFALPALLLSIVTPDPVPPNLLPAPGGWLAWLLPVYAAIMFGSMTLATMTLVPAISVREALRRATRRLPVGLGVMAIVLAALLVLIALLSQIIAFLPSAAPVIMLVLLSVMLIGAVRLSLVWPMLIDSDLGPIAVIQRTLGLTRTNFWRLLGLMLLAGMLSGLLIMVAELAGGSLLLLLGRAMGNDALGTGLVMALTAIVGGLCRMVVMVYMALLYRALAPA